MKQNLLLKLQRQFKILKKRETNLQNKLDYLDNLPTNLITEKTYNQWHTVYSKIKYLQLRIAKINEQFQIAEGK